MTGQDAGMTSINSRVHRISILNPRQPNIGFDILDGYRRFTDTHRAGTLAGSRTDPAGELGEIVGLQQPLERLLPQSPVNQIIPLRDQIIDGAAGGHPAQQSAGVAVRRAAIHTARPLDLQFFIRKMKVKFLPIPDSFFG